jgi:hypothetical protein
VLLHGTSRGVALYRDKIDLSQQIFSGITKASEVMAISRPALPGYANNIELDVTVQTPGLVTISNNVADLDLTGDFRIRGSLSNPIIIGRAEVNDGGELYFGPGIAVDEVAPLERRDRYAINRGIIEFNNAVRTEPDLISKPFMNSRRRTNGISSLFAPAALRALSKPSFPRIHFFPSPTLFPCF